MKFTTVEITEEQLYKLYGINPDKEHDWKFKDGFYSRQVGEYTYSTRCITEEQLFGKSKSEAKPIRKRFIKKR